MPECVGCGGPVENKNAAGHYRDRCCGCICEVAGADPAKARPIPGCECDDCRRAA
jgi:hypothetical protein